MRMLGTLTLIVLLLAGCKDENTMHQFKKEREIVKICGKHIVYKWREKLWMLDPNGGDGLFDRYVNVPEGVC